MTESKVAQALDRLSLQLRKLSEELSELKSEVKRLHHSLDKAIGDYDHSQKPEKTYEARVRAFKAYQEGTPHA